MEVSYDPMLMEPTHREQEAKARKAEREEMLSQMAAAGGKGTRDDKRNPGRVA